MSLVVLEGVKVSLASKKFFSKKSSTKFSKIFGNIYQYQDGLRDDPKFIRDNLGHFWTILISRRIFFWDSIFPEEFLCRDFRKLEVFRLLRFTTHVPTLASAVKCVQRAPEHHPMKIPFLRRQELNGHEVGLKFLKISAE